MRVFCAAGIAPRSGRACRGRTDQPKWQDTLPCAPKSAKIVSPGRTGMGRTNDPLKYAAPVYSLGEARYCIGIAAPSFRLKGPRLEEVIRAARTAATRLTERLQAIEF